MEEDYLEYNRDQFRFPRGFFNREKLRVVHEEISKLPKGSLVLDAGCGGGLISKDLMKDYAVFGVDANPNAIEFCKKTYSEGRYTLANIEETLPFVDNFFDGAIFVETIEHLPDPDRAVKELKRVLKENGVLVITTPNYDSLKWKLAERLWYPVFGGSCKPWRDDVHPSKFGKKKLEYITMRYFNSVSIGTFNFGMWLLAACRK